MPSDDANDHPAELSQIVETTDVISELDRVRRDDGLRRIRRQALMLLPPHVEVIPPIAVRAEYWNLRLRPRQTGANQQKPQPRFLRRLRTRRPRDEAHSRAGADRACADGEPAIASTRRHLEVSGPRQRVQASDRVVEPTPYARCQRRCAQGVVTARPSSSLDLVCEHRIGASDRLPRRYPCIAPDRVRPDESSSIHFAPCKADAGEPSYHRLGVRSTARHRRCADAGTGLAAYPGRHSAGSPGSTCAVRTASTHADTSASVPMNGATSPHMPAGCQRSQTAIVDSASRTQNCG